MGISLAVLGVVLVARTNAQSPEQDRYTPASRGGRAAVQELAEQHFAPEWVGWAVRTARCESSYDLYAHSAGYDRRLGVFYRFWGPRQVDDVTWGRLAWEMFEGPLSDPHVGAAMAGWIVERYGPGHWPYCGR